jgi:hypothetical protein
MRSWLKTATIATLFAAAIVVWGVGSLAPAAGAKEPAKKEPEKENLYPVDNYGWLTYYMHEVWFRYQDAKAAYAKNDLVLGEANLVVLELVIEASYDKLPDTLADGKPFNKDQYKKSMAALAQHSANVRKNKKWEAGSDGKDPIWATCVGCHDALKIPTDFKLDDNFKMITHIMHEVYELYRQAGIQFAKGETTGKDEPYDKAKSCFLCAKPYIDQIPKNIPDKNQDGQPIDKKLFDRAYSELSQLNQNYIKEVENKYWKTGKLLPPPKIVVDTCYQCHDKVVKIPNPW